MVNDGFTGFSPHDPEQTASTSQAGDPPRWLAASTLTDLLRQRGVQVDGGSGTGIAPAGRHQVATLDSLPLSAIVGEMLTESDNTTAELLAEGPGPPAARLGHHRGGATVVQDTVRRLGLPTTGPSPSTAPGLDLATGSRATCSPALLHRIGSHGPIAAGLPVAGRDRHPAQPA